MKEQEESNTYISINSFIVKFTKLSSIGEIEDLRKHTFT